jgi:hypothetical protein
LDRLDLQVGEENGCPFPCFSFVTILYEIHVYERRNRGGLKTGGRIVLVNMTRGEKRLQQFYEGISKFGSPLLLGCRGVLLRPFPEDLGFEEARREFVSRLGFPSEVLMGIKREIP